jgi:hypothetical protein
MRLYQLRLKNEFPAAGNKEHALEVTDVGPTEGLPRARLGFRAGQMLDNAQLCRPTGRSCPSR